MSREIHVSGVQKLEMQIWRESFEGPGRDLDFVESIAQNAAADKDGGALSTPAQNHQPLAQLQHAFHVHLIHVQQGLGHCGQPKAVIAEMCHFPRVRAECKVPHLRGGACVLGQRPELVDDS